ncbi:MAG: histidinol-phosphatase HisJ family protein [Clostridiales bacterium]|jgi:histidinol-phosphatase (PHP family)|nr:histidinol-phosphatase HisJ family protein [Clostridiales bacterium]
MLFNTHTHSTFSFDGSNSIIELCEQALKMGVSYFALTDHIELDGSEFCILDFDGYVSQIERCNSMFNKKGLYIALGAEFGWANDCDTNLISKCNFEYIINSVHSFEYSDISDKKSYYNSYLNAVLESLNAKYNYDAVGHLGFVTRYTDFEDNRIDLDTFGDKIDAILSSVIQKNKILEVNTSTNRSNIVTIPSIEILKLYRKKGGYLITFASDAHRKEKLIFNFERAREVVKEAGFEHWYIKKNGNLERIKI